jgi:hypothetical protein
MKIRAGFISNSSSSSFCILGVVADHDLNSEIKWDLPKGFVYEYGISDYDGEFIGMNPESLDENMTIKQHKEYIAKTLSESYGVEVKSEEVSWHCDGGYDG